MADQNQESTGPVPVPVDPEPIPVPIEPDAVVIDDDPLEEIGLVEVDHEQGSSKVHSLHASALGAGAHDFKRPLNITGTGATRCKLFHSRIAEAPLEHMQKSVNEWLDSDNIEVKHVGHVIGVMAGKSSEPNMVVMVWY